MYYAYVLCYVWYYVCYACYYVSGTHSRRSVVVVAIKGRADIASCLGTSCELASWLYGCAEG